MTRRHSDTETQSRAHARLHASKHALTRTCMRISTHARIHTGAPSSSNPCFRNVGSNPGFYSGIRAWIVGSNPGISAGIPHSGPESGIPRKIGCESRVSNPGFAQIPDSRPESRIPRSTAPCSNQGSRIILSSPDCKPVLEDLGGPRQVHPEIDSIGRSRHTYPVLVEIRWGLPCSKRLSVTTGGQTL